MRVGRRSEEDKADGGGMVEMRRVNCRAGDRVEESSGHREGHDQSREL